MPRHSFLYIYGYGNGTSLRYAIILNQFWDSKKIIYKY